MSKSLPEDPDELRRKARAHRATAAAESDLDRRRAYMTIASEYERLADAIEREFGQISPAAGRAQNGTRASSDPD